MRPAFKFLKHTPRGLKEKGKGLEEIAKSETKASEPLEPLDAKRLAPLAPLKFKSRS